MVSFLYKTNLVLFVEGNAIEYIYGCPQDTVLKFSISLRRIPTIILGFNLIINGF